MLSARFIQATLITTLLAGNLLALPTASQAESLFRATANYQDNLPYTPHSLFSVPLAKAVGDTITIVVNETTTDTSNAELKVTRNQVVNETGTSLFNNMLQFFANKLPIGGAKVTKYLSAPSFDGLNNANTLDSKAESTRKTTLSDSITCQVVQVLPNGQLMVQGHKIVDVNRDRQDFYVSGIVNPYYLDGGNSIQSTKVGNFQLTQGGKGVISRQQNDGIANKIYQFFN